MSEETVAAEPAFSRRPYRVPTSRVMGNDWTSLPVETGPPSSPQYRVTIVVPYYQAPQELGRTLAGLERQTYPRELFEVIVVDDGSDPPLTPPESPLDLRVEYQEDLGFGLARARNRGARAATGDILLFLDCDMIPEQDWVASHARWHHAAGDVLTIGFRFHVDVDGFDATDIRERPGTLAELFEGLDVTRPEWIEAHLARTRELTSDDDDLFRVVTGGNFGISRAFFQTVGGFDETFTRWGAEDREFAYRAYTLGSVLVPDREAICWHQGPGATLTDDERRSLGLQLAKISHLVANRAYRKETTGRSYTVPEYVVTLRPGDAPAESILTTVECLLASKTSDLVLWIEQRAADDSFEWMRLLSEPDPRIFFGPAGSAIDRFPAAAFHITMGCGASYDPWMIGRLRAGLGRAAVGTALFSEGPPVTIARSWALHRASRAGVDISHIGEVVEFPERNHVPEEFDRLEESFLAALGRLESEVDSRLAKLDHATGSHLDHRLALLEKRVRARFIWMDTRIDRRVAKLERLITDRVWYRIRRILRTILSRAVSVRSLSDARQFAIWFYDTARRRLGMRESPPRPVRTPRPRVTPTHRKHASYTLGADIVAIGPHAEAVFRASGRVRNSVVGDTGDPNFPFLGGRHVDLLVTDSSKLLDEVTEKMPPSASLLKLSEAPRHLSVPAFDPEQVNPIGWTPDHSDEVVALGPPSRLPDGVPVVRSSDSTDPEALRRFRHVEDVAGFHKSVAQRAGTLAELAASGVVVHIADRDPELEQHLGSELYALMTDTRSRTTDRHARESISIAMRRVALRTHSLRSRARQALSEGGIEGAGLPHVSILAPTRRPERLAATVAMIGRQNYPHLELVLGLHGAGFDQTSLDAATEGFDHPVVAVRVDAEQPLGEVLNAAASASGGTLLAKMDDDDAYGDDHIWDLVLAHEFARAELVAKASEYVYLSRSDMTLRLKGRHGERYVEKRSVSGGVLMISRHDLDNAGGWRRLPRQVDLALAEDVLKSGGRIYWTHGSGYARIRHGGRHTWKTDDSFFLERSEVSRPGFDLDFAGVRPPPAVPRIDVPSGE